MAPVISSQESVTAQVRATGWGRRKEPGDSEETLYIGKRKYIEQGIMYHETPALPRSRQEIEKHQKKGLYDNPPGGPSRRAIRDSRLRTQGSTVSTLERSAASP